MYVVSSVVTDVNSFTCPTLLICKCD